MAGARRHAREEEESEPGRERKRRKRKGGRRGVQGGSPGGSSPPRGGKQEVASGSPAQGTQLLPVGRRRRWFFFVENPLGFGGFLGNIKNCTLLQDFVKQTRSKDYENWQGLFREVVEASQILIANFFRTFESKLQ
jgi:hypothetical protein